MKSIGIFVDVGNLYYSIRRRFYERKLDYGKYLKKATMGESLYRAYAYGSQPWEDAISFITCLEHYGFVAKYEDFGDYENVTWTTGIIMDIMRNIDKVSTVVLGSNDLNMIPLLDYLAERRIRSVIFACGVYPELRDACDNFIEISEDMVY